MTSARHNLIADAIETAEEVREDNLEKPRLFVADASPDVTVSALRDILAAASNLYDRGAPVRLAFDQLQGGAMAQVMTPDSLVLMTHQLSRPFKVKTNRDGTICEVDTRLPRQMANMFLDWRGEWQLRPLNGIASAPMLGDEGSINSAEGYDPASGMWCEDVPDLSGLISDHPSRNDAHAALRVIRETFRTFPFADAEMIDDAVAGLAVVDTSKPPNRDESAFLTALLTAACRPSLPLAPGVIFRAASVSGAGSGKGLLVRCVCAIAFGRQPHAVTGGATPEELEKRIAAELMGGGPSMFLDNINNTALKSDLLASAMTERPARVRLLGRSQMMPLNSSAFIAVTGNGLSVSEDLARRFIAVELDPRTENPETRPFRSNILAEVNARRGDLLAALLTIWRWGRITDDLASGLPFGNFLLWSKWVRDPLIALGCRDPVERVGEAKERDGRRQAIADAFEIWWAKHGDRPVKVSGLHDDVRLELDPQVRGRQYLAAQVEKLTGTRGRILTHSAGGSGKVGRIDLRTQDHRWEREA